MRGSGARSRRDGDPLPPQDSGTAPAIREAQARGERALLRRILSNCHFPLFFLNLLLLMEITNPIGDLVRTIL
uniref:Uncharacterized protein n=1 Tax=Arundo donax TaxID=35708 RepID=A0A0A9FNC7_ARUDO